ncbi:MAG: hypothetical protein JOZ42_13555 [Acetobacteraceae bacterium]|nr:hypothetical protein [Acetobacteraceae bacterium]
MTVQGSAMRGLPILWPVLVFLLGSPVMAQPPGFRIHDHLGPDEIEETTALYLNGELVRTFRLNADHQEDVAELPAPVSADAVTYALCGQITVHGADGRAETRPVDGSGILTDVAGRDFDAVASHDFTVFFLTDVTVGRPASPIGVRRARSCAEAIS